MPFKLDVAITAAAFMMIGYVIHKLDIINLIFKKKILVPIIFVLLLYINIQLGTKSNGYVNLCDCVYKNGFKYYFSAISGSLCVLLLARLINKNKILEFYGKNSLFMFAFHSMFLFQTEYVLTKITHQQYFIMKNIPDNTCIICALIIYIMLGPLTLIYNYIFKKLKKAI